MSDIYKLHHITPEQRKISIIINKLRDGAVMLYPTDTGFTLGCELGNKNAIEKLRNIRKISDKKSLTFLCNDLSNIAEYAIVSNLAYKTIKRLIPGPYTFILPATKLVPKLAMNPNRKTAGIRIPSNPIATRLVEEMNVPIISISAKIDTDSTNIWECLQPDEIIERFTKLVDVVVYSDVYHFEGESTVINMVNDDFEIIREGAKYNVVTQALELND